MRHKQSTTGKLLTVTTHLHMMNSSVKIYSHVSSKNKMLTVTFHPLAPSHLPPPSQRYKSKPNKNKQIIEKCSDSACTEHKVFIFPVAFPLRKSKE